MRPRSSTQFGTIPGAPVPAGEKKNHRPRSCASSWVSVFAGLFCELIEERSIHLAISSL